MVYCSKATTTTINNMKAVILLFVFTLCSGQFKKRCKECPESTYPCDQNIFIAKGNCLCSVCITRCSYRDKRCEIGEECIEVPSQFSNELKVAKCQKFTSCPDKTCVETCSVSGYFYDANGCNTCLCNDPCIELQCPNGCIKWTSSFFMEPFVDCDDEKETAKT